jgi:hypothetical protein
VLLRLKQGYRLFIPVMFLLINILFQGVEENKGNKVRKIIDPEKDRLPGFEYFRSNEATKLRNNDKSVAYSFIPFSLVPCPLIPTFHHYVVQEIRCTLFYYKS